MKNTLITSTIFILFSLSLFSQQTSSGWVASITGSGFNNPSQVITDQTGNIYTIGVYAGSADVSSLSGANSISSQGGLDVFITKHDPDGTLIWLSTFGGSDNEMGFDIDVNDAGEVIAVGTFEGSADFGEAPGDVTLTAAGQQDIFIAKIDANGMLIWAKRIGGSSVDEANGVALDADDNVYVVGRFVSTVDFDPGAGTSNLSAGGSPDAFVLKLDENGDFLWAHDFGSGDNEEAEDVVIDSENNPIITGSFSGTMDFDPGPGETSIYGDGAGDPFHLKLSPSGDLIWVTTFTSDGYVFSADIDIDEDDNIVTHGFFSKDINFNPESGGQIILSEGSEDSYTAKINSNGELVWANILGGYSIEFGYGVAVDAIGDVYITGLYYDSPDLDPGLGEFFLPSSGIEDTYIVKYDGQGNFVWAKQTGGSSSDAGYGIAISPTGDIAVVGNYWGTSDLDPESDATLNVSSQGGSDAFILKIDQIVSSLKFNQGASVKLIISPNPSADFIKLESDLPYPFQAQLINGLGAAVTKPILVHTKEQEISMSQLSPGVYYLRVVSEEGRLIRKVVRME